MSTNTECLFIEVARNRWYYLLESYGTPKQVWDWREDATTYGPFSSLEIAEKHLANNPPNPGGACIQHLPNGIDALDLDADPVLKAAIARSYKPEPRDFWPRF
jgi:hypothetical protein